MNRFKTFTGGVLDTHCFYYQAKEGTILFDAPQGSDEAFAGLPVDLLLITHGHFDHVADGAAIIKRHGCKAAYHPDTAPMITDREFFIRFGFGLEVEPFAADFPLQEGPANFLGTEFQLLHVPGHCPGSIAFYQPNDAFVVGGDVLMKDGYGRYDLPGGNQEQLFDSIEKKLLTLPDEVVLLPGHGPTTTIGRERRENPFLA